ncbi:GNAT family N-acetyltransferase [Eubacteriales bacterium OttesenSCG-928-G02]|nr:GNAT family N-acetyltransferase [Eubacteriales bacterium OttesenSCG-928-G02]
MNLLIKKLNPDLAEDYVHFFDVTPHDDGTDKDEFPCYCVTWRSDAAYTDGSNHWFPTREERRKRAIQFVKDGHIQGYLAYLEGEIVGWCNTNGDCRLGLNYLRTYWPIEEYREDVRVKSVFCFAIASKVQRTGVATQLLKRICEDAAADGYNFVEAYVYKDTSAVPHDFRGPLSMYEKCGFTKTTERDNVAVVRKALGDNDVQ